MKPSCRLINVFIFPSMEFHLAPPLRPLGQELLTRASCSPSLRSGAESSLYLQLRPHRFHVLLLLCSLISDQRLIRDRRRLRDPLGGPDGLAPPGPAGQPRWPAALGLAGKKVGGRLPEAGQARSSRVGCRMGLFTPWSLGVNCATCCQAAITAQL